MVAGVAQARPVAKSIVGVAGVIIVESGTIVRAFGQIVLSIVGCKIFLFQCGVGHAQARGMVPTFLKHATHPGSLRQRDGPPPKQWWQCLNRGFSFARTTGWAYNAGPILFVGGRVVEVLVVATRGRRGPGRLGTGGALFIGFFALDRASFAVLLATGVLVLMCWAV